MLSGSTDLAARHVTAPGSLNFSPVLPNMPVRSARFFLVDDPSDHSRRNSRDLCGDLGPVQEIHPVVARPCPGCTPLCLVVGHALVGGDQPTCIGLSSTADLTPPFEPFSQHLHAGNPTSYCRSCRASPCNCPSRLHPPRQPGWSVTLLSRSARCSLMVGLHDGRPRAPLTISAPVAGSRRRTLPLKVRHLALNLIRAMPGKQSIKGKRKLATGDTDYLVAALQAR